MAETIFLKTFLITITIFILLVSTIIYKSSFSEALHKVTKKMCNMQILCCFLLEKKTTTTKKDFAKPLQSPCGKTGIRTLETLLTFTHFPGVPLQPLEHLSCFSVCKSTLFFLIYNILFAFQRKYFLLIHFNILITKDIFLQHFTPVFLQKRL